MIFDALRTQLGPLTLEHPVINASGTFDLLEAAQAIDETLLRYPPVSAYVPKTVTLHPRRGNEPPRIVEAPSGMLNSIGLPNQGVEAFCREELRRLLELPCPVILNVAGFSRDEYLAAVERLRREIEELWPFLPWDVDSDVPGSDRGPASKVGLEVNISCPNVHSGCMSIGTDAGETYSLVSALREVWPKPFLLAPKLTPNVTDIQSIAMAAEQAGADAVSLVNTFKGMALDPASLRPLLGGVTGGLSGPAIKPLALRAVYEVRETIGLPIIGLGGVSEVQDVLDFMAAGATVVAVGSSGFRDPWLAKRLALALAAELELRSLSLPNLIGCAHSRH